MPGRSAIIIGGGIGGLSAALQLRRSGFDVSVFEAREELSEVNTGLSLWAFAVRRLGEIGLGDLVASIGRPIERVVHRDPSGRLIGDVDVKRLNARIGCPSYELHRSKLQRLLADRLGHDSIAFGRRCISVGIEGPRAQAVFGDGATVEADLLVGADGVHSVVREAVCPAARLRRGQVGVWRGIVPVQEDEVSTGMHLRVMGPARLFGVARVSDELVRWYAGAKQPASEPRTNGEIKRLAMERFDGWPVLVRDILGRTSEEDYLFNDTPHLSPLRNWGQSRITLLGDAGHAALPTLGISAGLAIEDAAVLGECLRSSTNEATALRAYERQRRRVTARVIRAAAIFGRILMIERQPAYGLRQLGARLAPQHVGVRWLVGGAQRQ